MKVKNTSFEINPAHIGNTSTCKDEITLPYDGPVPAEMVGCTDTAIVCNLHADYCALVLVGKRQKKTLRNLIEAMPEEIDGILHSLFYTPHDPTTDHTRFDSGLNDYWLGYFQSLYGEWKRFTKEPGRICQILRELPKEVQQKALWHIERAKAEGEF